jgi:hypothetical protein
VVLFGCSGGLELLWILSLWTCILGPAWPWTHEPRILLLCLLMSGLQMSTTMPAYFLYFTFALNFISSPMLIACLPPVYLIWICHAPKTFLGGIK